MTCSHLVNNRIFCIGEALLDIIFDQGQVVAAKPGGAMLNTAASLGSTGLPVELITDFGQDSIGDLIAGFLSKTGVSSAFAERYKEGKTALAIAILDQEHNASYSFYRDFPSERMRISFPEVHQADLIAFGSFYALTEGIREKLSSFLHHARQKGAFVLYDPNFRKPHLPELSLLLPFIRKNISMADIVRGSDEDFRNIFNAKDGKTAFNHIKKAGSDCLIYTTAGYAEVFSGKNHWIFSNPPLIPVSTIGAGDAFNAGILYYLFKHGSGRKTVPVQCRSDWEKMIATGTLFARQVCMSHDNYISTSFVQENKMKE